MTLLSLRVLQSLSCSGPLCTPVQNEKNPLFEKKKMEKNEHDTEKRRASMYIQSYNDFLEKEQKKSGGEQLRSALLVSAGESKIVKNKKRLFFKKEGLLQKIAFPSTCAFED